MSEPLLLSRRLAANAPEAIQPQQAQAQASPGLLRLAMSAGERQRLRGHCRSSCGRDLLLQLPRGEGPLEPGECLAGDDGIARVRVEAAPEALLRARCDDPFTLLRAAYHLGNRHVALELRQGELRLLEDPVLAQLLRGLGGSVEPIHAPFRPEGGAYGSGGHSHGVDHSHSHGDSHRHSHSSTQANNPDLGHGHAQEHGHGHRHGHSGHESQHDGHNPGHGQLGAPAQLQPRNPALSAANGPGDIPGQRAAHADSPTP